MKNTSAKLSKPLCKKILAVRAVAFDVDGVLTDGRIILYGTTGEAKSFDSQDGQAMRMAGQEGGLILALITGRNSVVVARRARELGIVHLFQGAKDKRIAYESFKAACGLEDAAIAYMGDDIVDLPLLRQVGLALAPANAVPEVKAAADYVTHAAAGRGAAREAIELILKIQGKWEALIESYR